MAAIARYNQETKEKLLCSLPFCHTVEGGALGGNVNYGDEFQGPRASTPVVDSLEDLLKLPDIDFQKGRIAEVLKACHTLKEEGKFVSLDIAGPFTILNGLIDVKHA